jgi:hypothetical protein
MNIRKRPGAAAPRLAFCLALAGTAISGVASAQIRVNPNGVNVSSQTPTTAFLTFGGLSGYAPAEALWCGALVPASPAIGLRCDPAAIFGVLPARFDLSTASGQSALTDIMSIPLSVTQRAFEDARAGASSEFFYVRRFVKAGEPDQFVAVTCRFSGGGARTPLALVDVQLAFGTDSPVAFVAPKQKLPGITASIVYTGSGRLQGRWEVVLPGENLPSDEDLLTEATLPAERRPTQRRYSEVGRFSVFLDPIGRAKVPPPDTSRLPTMAEGAYYVLLRIEATDDREASSDLAAVGAGVGLVRAGGVAGFPIPPLRYVVGSGSARAAGAAVSIEAISPAEGFEVDSTTPIDLRWKAAAGAAYVRFELRRDLAVVHRALLTAEATSYRLPPFVVERAGQGALEWRVVTVFDSGTDGPRSSWRRVVVR